MLSPTRSRALAPQRLCLLQYQIASAQHGTYTWQALVYIYRRKGRREKGDKGTNEWMEGKEGGKGYVDRTDGWEGGQRGWINGLQRISGTVVKTMYVNHSVKNLECDM